MIARAMQEYGLWVVDVGGKHGFALYTIDPRSASGDVYAGSLPAEDFVYLEHIPLDRLRVLKLGSQNPAAEKRLAENPCARFE